MEDLLEKIRQLSDQLDRLDRRLHDIEHKLDALIYSDEDAQEYLSDPEISDDLIHDALQVLVQYDKASVSLLQRRLAIGFRKAQLLIDYFEKDGILGPQVGAQPRDVLITDPQQYWDKRRRN